MMTLTQRLRTGFTLGAVPAPRVLLALARRRGQQRRIVGADRWRAVAVRGRPQRRHHRHPGADGQHPADDAAGPAGGRPRRRVRPSLAAVRRADLLRRGGRPAHRAHGCRADAPRPAAHLHLRHRRRPGGAGHHLAGPDHRAGAPQRAGGRHPARHGQRQRGSSCRPRPGRLRDRALGRPTGLRDDRCRRQLPGLGAAGLAPSSRPARRAGALHPGSGGRWALCTSRAGGPTDPAALRHLHLARLRGVGAVAADREPAAGPGRGWLRAAVRVARRSVP